MIIQLRFATRNMLDWMVVSQFAFQCRALAPQVPITLVEQVSYIIKLPHCRLDVQGGSVVLYPPGKDSNLGRPCYTGDAERKFPVAKETEHIMQESLLSTKVQARYDIDRILAELDDFEGKYPKAAVAAARQNRVAVIPRLIEAIDRAIIEVQATGEVAGNAAFFAMLFLGEFEAKEALPSILRAMSLPDEQPFELFGDCVHEHVPRILAALADTPEDIDRIIENRSLDEYVRGSAANSYLHLVYDGKLTRAEAVFGLQRQLRAAIEHQDAQGANWLVNYLYDLSPQEAMDDIREAYRLNLVDESLLDLETVEEWLQSDDDPMERAMSRIAYERKSFPVDDVEGFGWVRDGEPKPARIVPPPHQRAWVDDEFDDEPDVPEGTIRYTGARVGRNEPCPCGSGKKFKKCCGSH